MKYSPAAEAVAQYPCARCDAKPGKKCATTRDALRFRARLHEFRFGSLNKHDMAWHMAQKGLIDKDGYLRDGFPEAAL